MAGADPDPRPRSQRTSGCELPHRTPYIIVAIDYQPTGVFNHGALESQGLSPACARLATTMAALTIAAPGRPIEPGEAERVVLAFHPDYLDCLAGDVDDGRASETPPIRVAGSGMTPPLDRRVVRPPYPESVRRARVEGVEIVEAIISARGCVQDVEVVRSVHPDLDFPALYAVLQRQYLPGRLDGRPVAAIMNVFVNFSLRP